MSQSFNLGAQNNSVNPWLFVDKAIDFGSALGVAAYNNHNAKRAAERQLEAQKELMGLQYQYNKQAYDYQQTQGPTLYRQGLTSAGYNPILPFVGHSGLTNANFGSTSQGSAALENPALVDQNSINQARLVRLQQNQIKSQIENTNANSNLQNEQALTEQSKRINYEFQNSMLDVEKHLKDKDLSWYDRRAYAQVYKDMQQAELARSEIGVQSYNSISNRMSAGASVVNARTNEFNSRTDRYNSITNRFRFKGAGLEINSTPFYFDPIAEIDYYKSIY